jgi:hypothetical protein
VAVHNYLKSAQTVSVELQPQPWFELADRKPARRRLTLKGGEVSAVVFRIRAKKVGRFPLTVQARGPRAADAVRRTIDVLPEGRPVEQAVSTWLEGTVRHVFDLPAGAIEGASRLDVKIQPGPLGQLLQGAESLLRLPDG